MNTAAQTTQLAQLLDDVQARRNWSRPELAKALNRDPSRLVPASGNPRIDLVAAIAGALEQSVGYVVERINGPAWDLSLPKDQPPIDASFEQLWDDAVDAASQGEVRRLYVAAAHLHAVASDDSQRALAHGLRASACLERGLFRQALDTIRRAPRAGEDWIRRNLRTNEAEALCGLGFLAEAHAMCDGVTRDLEATDRRLWTRSERNDDCFIRGVRSNIRRRLASSDPDHATAHLEGAHRDALRALETCYEIASLVPENLVLAHAHSHRSAVIEIEARLGVTDPETACARLLSHLDPPSEAGRNERWWIAIGWSAIHGCNIAIHALSGEQRSRNFAIFSEKALAIADRISNAGIIALALELEHTLATIEDGPEILRSLLMDHEDERLMTLGLGSMRRFRSLGRHHLGLGDPTETPVQRLARLVDLACRAQGISQGELARRVGRDVSRLVPTSGLPKLDYAISLAEALCWPVEDVIDAVCGTDLDRV